MGTLFQLPVFEAVCEYLEFVDIINLTCVCTQARNLYDKELRAKCVLKRAMRRWNFLRIVRNRQGQVFRLLGATYHPRGEMIGLLSVRHRRSSPLPIIHKLAPNVMTLSPSASYGMGQCGDWICSIHWHFYDVEVQPQSCILETGGGRVIDPHFTGVFTDPFPVMNVAYIRCNMRFPPEFSKKKMYTCIKYANIVKPGDRVAYSHWDGTWRSNTGNVYRVAHGMRGITNLEGKEEDYQPSLYKEINSRYPSTGYVFIHP